MKAASSSYDIVAFLLQGGGALGAYQVGVCQRLMDEGWQPDWVIGTSIGAINAAIIAGNAPQDRSDRLQAFWDRIVSTDFFPIHTGEVALEKVKHFYAAEQALWNGQPNFFSLRQHNPWWESNITPDKLSFYDTQPLKETLKNIIDFDRLNHQDVRVTLSALCLDEGILTQFDNRERELTVEHVMASGALPPGFPAIKIDEKYYWDGGISSNTPLMALLEEPGPKKILCFMIDLFSNQEDFPTNMMDVLKRKKDLEFASRYHRMLHYFCMLHRMRTAMAEVCKTVPAVKHHPAMSIMDHMAPCDLDIVRFHYTAKPSELWSKDFDFSRASVLDRQQTGYRDVDAALVQWHDQACWTGEETGVRLFESNKK